MDLDALQHLLADLQLGLVAYFPVVGSTNSEALRWIDAGAPHLSLVVADQQTAGRGRAGRTWYSLPGVSLSFSLVLRSKQIGFITPPRLTGLGALAVCDVLQSYYDLEANIKWPNDVLVNEGKLSGVLVEAQWQGEEILSAVMGIGINVARDSVPSQGDLDYPATSLEVAYGKPVNRWNLLKQLLEALLTRLPQLGQDAFIQAWEGNLVYRGELVRVLRSGKEPITGYLMGLNRDGFLRLERLNGEKELIQSGDLKLRPG